MPVYIMLSTLSFCVVFHIFVYLYSVYTETTH